MDDRNLFSEVNEGKDKLGSAIKRTAMSYLPYILLAVIIVCRVAMEIFTTKVVNPFTPVFFLDTTVSFVLTIFCYIVFIPQGEKNEKAINEAYRTNCIEWGRLSEKIRSGGLLTRFRAYCLEQVDVERKERRMEIIGNRTTISYDEYEARYAAMSDEELKGIYKGGELTKGEYRAILKANGKISVKPINSVLILSGVAKGNYNDAGRSESGYIIKWLAQRPLWIVLFAVVTNALTGSFTGMNVSAIYGMILDTLSIIVASFVGYGAGEQSVRDRNDKIKGKILFINGFWEENK